MNKRYRSKVRVINTQYFVDEEAKSITCMMHVSLQQDKLPGYEIFKYSYLDKDIARKFPYFVNTYIGQFKVRTTVKCSKNDKFDVRLGKRIAEAKCKIKAFRTGMKVHQFIGSELKKAAASYFGIMDACEAAKKVEENHLEVLNNEVCSFDK